MIARPDSSFLLVPFHTAVAVALLTLVSALAACEDNGPAPVGSDAADTLFFNEFGVKDVVDDVPVNDTAPVDTAPDPTPDPEPPDEASGDDSATPETGPETADDGGGVELPDPDIPCDPACTDRVCGPDGCGGICGYCAYPTVCDADGQCVEICVPDCEGKFCGGDGCGGTCGDCVDDLECGQDGLCYEPTCVPDCTGKICGSDGCGADCGFCAAPDVCTNGNCQLGPCGTISETGQCDGSLLKWCEELVNLEEDDCSQYGYVCGYDGQINKYTCKEPGVCTPNCGGKNCGSDGCDGVCGTCPANWSCALGECQPQVGGGCGSITPVGQCVGNTLWWCTVNNNLSSLDCTLPPTATCGWDIANSKFNCL